MSIAAASAADKPPAPFKPGPAAGFTSHQTNGKVTIGAETYASGEKIKVAFGKLDPNRYQVLPVLVVIQNDGDRAISLDQIRVEYISPSRDRVYATPARDVRYLKGPKRPALVGGPAGTVAKLGQKKNPLADPVIEVRAFAAQMLPAGNTASGFFYFDSDWRPGATLYITGLKEAGTGKDLEFFELTLQ